MAGADQATQHVTANPAVRFVELLRSALSSGEAHVTRFDGKHPLAVEAWGSRERPAGTGDFTRMEWQPQGKRIGWLDGDDLYVDPPASHGVAQVMGQRIGDQLGVTPATLRRRLRDHKILASTDTTRGTLTIRKMVGEVRREVLHFRSESLLPLSLPDQPDHADGYAALLQGDRDAQADKTTRPPGNPSGNGVSPDSGQFGQVSEQVESLQEADRDADRSETAPCSWCEQPFPSTQLDPGGLCPSCSPTPAVRAE